MADDRQVKQRRRTLVSRHESPSRATIRAFGGLKWRPFCAAGIVVGGCVCVSLPGCARARTVAVVNGQTITEADLKEQSPGRASPFALQELIDDVLLEQQARAKDVKVTETEVDNDIAERKRRASSQADFERMMEQSGVGRARFRQWVRRDLLTDKLTKLEVQTTEEELRAYYRSHRSNYLIPERVRVRDMLLDSRENAAEVLKVLRAGGDFAGLAKDLSLDPVTKASGGDMGELPLNSLAPHLRKAAAALKPGQVSNVIEAPDGWYLLKLEERRPARQQKFEEVKAEVRRSLTEEKQSKIKASYLPSLRKRAKVTLLDPSLRVPSQSPPAAK